MGKITLFFGNGIGMAIDPIFFNLEKVILNEWDKLNENERMDMCQYGGLDGAPQEEEYLCEFHKTLSACETIIQKNKNLLSNEGQNVPALFWSFLNSIGIHFLDLDVINTLPEKFSDPLVEFIKKEKPNIATINYDALLYRKFNSTDLMRGDYAETSLVDGFLSNGFNQDNLIRKNDHNFGWYLHLHGTPLYIDNGNTVKKKKIQDMRTKNENRLLSKHFVLSNGSYKPMIINSSPVLHTYWDYFSYALNESDKVVIFGYSGKDDHINEKIKNLMRNKEKIIIEWENNDNNDRHFDERNKFWMEKLGENIKLNMKANILDFTDWPN